MGVVSSRKGGAGSDGVFSLSEEEMQEIINDNVDVILEGWEEAATNGWSDVVFIWMLEGEDLRYVCAPRELTLAVLQEETIDIPEEIQKRISAPAGPQHAWLLFIAPEWAASMRIQCLRNSELN